MAQRQIVRDVSYWHEQVVDWMLLNPHMRMKDCAEHFNVSTNWLSILVNSDMFKDYKAKRYEEHHARVSEQVLARVHSLADTSLAVLQERINENRKTVSLEYVQSAAELALRSLGVGAKPAAPASSAQQNVIHLNFGNAPKDVLESARADMRRLHAGNTVDAEVVPPRSGGLAGVPAATAASAPTLPPLEPFVRDETQLELPLAPAAAANPFAEFEP